MSKREKQSIGVLEKNSPAFRNFNEEMQSKVMNMQARLID